MMDGIPKDESNGYRCNNFNGATSDGILRRTSSNSMSEGTNEEGHGKEEEEWGDNENKKRNSYIPSKGRFVWGGAECELVDDVGLFIANSHVIACDPKEVIIDN